MWMNGCGMPNRRSASTKASGETESNALAQSRARSMAFPSLTAHAFSMHLIGVVTRRIGIMQFQQANNELDRTDVYFQNEFMFVGRNCAFYRILRVVVGWLKAQPPLSVCDFCGHFGNSIPCRMEEFKNPSLSHVVLWTFRHWCTECMVEFKNSSLSYVALWTFVTDVTECC